MTYELINKLWACSVVAAVLIWAVLLSRLVFGLVKRRKEIVRTSIKYIVNTITFLFAYAVYFSFFIVVQVPHGMTKDDSIRMLNDWVGKEAMQWCLWGLLLMMVLAIFNVVYQLKIEKIKGNVEIILLAILSMLIMTFGIFLGSYNAILGLTEEINRHSY